MEKLHSNFSIYPLIHQEFYSILCLYFTNTAQISRRDISDQIKNLYDVEISSELVSKIREKILPEVTIWQNRPLEPVYPFVFLDAIHYKVKGYHQYQTQAAYVVLGITMDGKRYSWCMDRRT